MASKQATGKSQFCKSRKVIESFYAKHFTLLRYLRKVKQRKAIRLIQDLDPVEYRVLLKSTLVAVRFRDQSATLPFNPTQTQCFTLKEITNRVIEHVCRSNKTNVLAFGFESLSGYGKKGTVAGTIGIQNSYPNTIVSYLRSTRAWQVLHERIGDDLMVHLLQNVSMFVKVNAKCYFQVAGYPISRLSPLSTSDVTPHLLDKPVIQSAGVENGVSAVLKRKTRRGGKRARRYRENSSQSQKEKEDLPDVPGKGDETHGLHVDVESVHEIDVVAVTPSPPAVLTNPAEMDGSHGLDAFPELPQNKQKRKLESYDNNEQPRAKKARIPCNVSDDADKPPECGSVENIFPEVSPLLFPDESSENSSQESAHLCVRNSDDLDSAENARELRLHDGVSTSLFRDNIEKNAVEECCDEVENCLHGNEEKESSVMSVETNVGTLKRKKSLSRGAGRKNKANVRQKPWQYLLKFIPKTGQTNSKRHPCGVRSDRQTKQNNRQQRDHPASKKNREGIRLNEVSLPRATLFYSSNLSQTLPKKHIMEISPVSMAGARRLVQQIFPQGSCLATSGHGGGITGSEKRDDHNAKSATTASTNHDVLRTAAPIAQKRKPFRLPKKLKKVQPLLLKFLAKHKRCPFRTLLRHHCYYHTQKRDKKSKKRRILQRLIPFNVKMMYHKQSWKSGTKPTKLARREKKRVKVDALLYRHAVNNYTKHDQVVRFLQCICHKVVPKELWGSSDNKATFLRNLAKFIRLHRAETFTLGQLMAGIKVSSCEWLKDKGSAKKHIPLSHSLKQQQLLAQFIWWFVTQYLMVVLKTFFYITESGAHRQRVFYYRKPVWKKIHRFGLNTFCGEFFKPLKAKEADELLRRPSSLGFSLLRFIPKSSTVRPITNMRHRPTIKEPINAQKQQPVNWKLQNVFEVLKFEKERNPKSLGTTLFGTDDLYRALKPFVARVRTSLERRPLYFVHVDVKNCYESILHQKLFDVIKQVLEEEEYLIRRLSLLRVSAGKVYREFLKHVSTADDCRSFPDFFRSLVTAWKLKEVIAVDNVWYVTEDRDKLVNILGEHIFNNIVRIGNNYYQQERGIAQGSVLSTMLCGYYYSQMEGTHLSEISEDPDSLLLRWVDDFLFITPQKSLADKFLNVMHAGIPEYGCFINHDKTLTNYDVVAADGREVERVGASERFPWCGFLLDTVTLEVSADLSRYTGLLLRDTLTVSLNAHPGEALRRKLLCSVRPKCHPLLLDHYLNTRQSILLNVYHVFLLIAYKFHTYIKDLPRGGQPKDNPPFFCRLILDLAQYFHSASSRKCRQMSPREVTFSLDEREVTWLCFHAFQSCLRKKQSRYGELLKFLRKGLSQLRLPAEDFKTVIDTSQHAVFKLIR